jgi:ABC-type Na+ transport system ATPase subunit NatA
VVLRDVSLQVSGGECVGLAAESGETAALLLRVLATLVRPSSGSMRVSGVDAIADPFAARRRVAFAAAGPAGDAGGNSDYRNGLDPRLTVEEHLGFVLAARRIAGEGGSRRGAAVSDITSRIGVRRGLALGALPADERTLVGIAACVLSAPDVLLLEEPAAGFGEAAGRALALIDDARNSGAAVVLAVSSRNSRVPSCRRWLWLDDGGHGSERREPAGVMHDSMTPGQTAIVRPAQ